MTSVGRFRPCGLSVSSPFLHCGFHFTRHSMLFLFFTKPTNCNHWQNISSFVYVFSFHFWKSEDFVSLFSAAPATLLRARREAVGGTWISWDLLRLISSTKTDRVEWIRDYNYGEADTRLVLLIEVMRLHSAQDKSPAVILAKDTDVLMKIEHEKYVDLPLMYLTTLAVIWMKWKELQIVLIIVKWEIHYHW